MVEFGKTAPPDFEPLLRLRLLEDEILRKLIGFDDETWNALKLLAGDRMATLQELADEAFADLLEKHGRPVDLRKALRESAKAAGGRSAGKKAKADDTSDKKNVVSLAAKRKTKK